MLRHSRVVDPACGSGAFLVAAFDYLHAEFVRTNERLAALQGEQPELFALDRQIPTENLYGVDLSSESVESTKLALWLKTARPSRPLNDLDGNIKCGNLLVSPSPDLAPELAARAFAWQAGFPAATKAGGFDCVIGTPPEWLAPYKPAFQREFICFSDTADAYLYFFERGLAIPRAGGNLGFISSGTFATTNDAAPFRAWLPTASGYLRVVNFGENQPFADAEMVFPTISILKREPGAGTYRTYFMRDRVPDSIPEAVASDGIDCDESVLARSEWRFQPPAVSALFDRIMAVGKPLDGAVGGRIYYGVKTGLNDAFDEPKILRPDIAKLPRFCWDDAGCSLGNAGYLLPGNPWLLPLLQSRVLWFCISQISTALRLREGLWQFRCINPFMVRLRVPDLADADRQALAELGLAAVETARERYALQGKVAHRILVDFAKDGKGLNNALSSWWQFDFATFREQVKKAFGSGIPLADRDDWENALAAWCASHGELAAKLIGIETEINDRVYRLFGLSAADTRLLTAHAHHAMIDYLYGGP